MEAGSLDGDSAPRSKQAWRLAAWMVILQPAVDFLDLCEFHRFLGPEVGRPITTRLDRRCSPKGVCNLGTSILMTEPGWRPAAMEAGSLDGDSAPCSRQAWRLAAWMVILQPASDSKWICVDDGKRWYSDGRFSDVL